MMIPKDLIEKIKKQIKTIRRLVYGLIIEVIVLSIILIWVILEKT